MTESAILEELREEMRGMRRDISFIKRRVADVDIILTDYDELSLQRARADVVAGRTRKL